MYVVRTKLQENALVFIQIKKSYLSKIYLKKKMEGRGIMYIACGLDIGCGWGVEMYNDFDKHCFQSETVDTRKSEN